MADGDQLDQVLWALLDNAVKYGQGTVAVEIGVDAAERMLWTTISDGGRGLEESDRAWLFGRFARGAAGRTSGNGSGRDDDEKNRGCHNKIELPQRVETLRLREIAQGNADSETGRTLVDSY